MIEALVESVMAERHPGLSGQLILRLWRRLGKIAARLMVLDTWIARTRVSGSGDQSPPDESLGKPAFKPGLLPTGVAWLLRLMPSARAYAPVLQSLLAEPEMVVLLRTCPKLGRLLRPLCQMLGVPLPPQTMPLPADLTRKMKSMPPRVDALPRIVDVPPQRVETSPRCVDILPPELEPSARPAAAQPQPITMLPRQIEPLPRTVDAPPPRVETPVAAKAARPDPAGQDRPHPIEPARWSVSHPPDPIPEFA